MLWLYLRRASELVVDGAVSDKTTREREREREPKIGGRMDTSLDRSGKGGGR